MVMKHESFPKFDVVLRWSGGYHSVSLQTAVAPRVRRRGAERINSSNLRENTPDRLRREGAVERRNLQRAWLNLVPRQGIPGVRLVTCGLLDTAVLKESELLL